MGFEKISLLWTVIFPAAVLLYYFFRKRYDTEEISSILFWERTSQETKVSPYLKNLQRNLLFYLQMAALLLLVLALIAPFITKDEKEAEQLLIVIDTSASMLAEKEGKTILDESKELMGSLVEDLQESAVTIITTGKEPKIIVQKETDISVVKNAIQNIDSTYENEAIANAVELVSSIVTVASAEVHIFTNGPDPLADMNADESIAWVIHRFDSAIDNFSIDKFGAVQTAEGIEAIVKVTGNSSAGNQDGEVVIKNGLTGEKLKQSDFSLKEGEPAYVSFKNIPKINALSAELLVQDSYKADNEAFAVLGKEPGEVLMDSRLHSLLKKAFDAGGATAATVSAEQMKDASSDSLLVSSETALLKKSASPILLIGRDDAAPKEVTGNVQNTAHPLFALADLDDVYVSAVYPPFKSYTTIATAGDQPFIQISDQGDIIILANIEDTDWPLHPSFPLFIWSSIEWLTSDTGSIGSFYPNERKSVLTDEQPLEIFTVSDEYVSGFSKGTDFIAPAKPGIYKTLDEKLLTVQLEAAEKEMHAGKSYRAGRQNEEMAEQQGKLQLNWYLIWLILIILLLEWEVQRRRGLTN